MRGRREISAENNHHHHHHHQNDVLNFVIPARNQPTVITGSSMRTAAPFHPGPGPSFSYPAMHASFVFCSIHSQSYPSIHPYIHPSMRACVLQPPDRSKREFELKQTESQAPTHQTPNPTPFSRASKSNHQPIEFSSTVHRRFGVAELALAFTFTFIFAFIFAFELTISLMKPAAPPPHSPC
jgi:hypothetical protein